MTIDDHFTAYLLEVFDEQYDESDIRHITFFAIFKAGFEAGNGAD